MQTYLREEVMQEGLTRNIGHFSRFLEAASFSQGAIINVSNTAREAQVERPVAENYFSIFNRVLDCKISIKSLAEPVEVYSTIVQLKEIKKNL